MIHPYATLTERDIMGLRKVEKRGGMYCGVDHQPSFEI